MSKMICLTLLTDHDRNFDGAVTISDMLLNIKAYANLPMGVVYDLLYGGKIYQFFELSPNSCNSNLSLVPSIMIWSFFCIFLQGVIKKFSGSKLFESYSEVQEREKEKRKDLGY
jgi:hypothetical protein